MSEICQGCNHTGHCAPVQALRERSSSHWIRRQELGCASLSYVNLLWWQDTPNATKSYYIGSRNVSCKAREQSSQRHVCSAVHIRYTPFFQYLVQRPLCTPPALLHIQHTMYTVQHRGGGTGTAGTAAAGPMLNAPKKNKYMIRSVVLVN